MVNEVSSEQPNPALGQEAKELDSETPQSVLSKRRIGLFLGGVLLLGGLGIFGVRSMTAKPDDKATGRNAKQQVTLVMVATATQKTVPVQLQAAQPRGPAHQRCDAGVRQPDKKFD